jgi:hypothetical protein
MNRCPGLRQRTGNHPVGASREFCFDGVFDQDREEAANLGVEEVLCRVAEVLAHLGLGVLAVVGVLGDQAIFELGQLGVQPVIGLSLVCPCSVCGGRDIPPVHDSV